MIRRPPRSTLDRSSAASDVYKRQLINCSVLSSSLDPLSLRGDVGALSLSYRYHSGKCSRELITHVPPPLRCLRSTTGAVSALEYCVDIRNSRLVCCGASFFPPPLFCGILFHLLYF